MGNREKALLELQRQIREQKARIDPEVLKMAQAALQSRQHGDESEPYDRKAALKAIELFLRHHDDPQGFERKLRELLTKSRH